MGCITTNLAARWPNRLMPVAFAPNVTPAVRAIINGAINAWNNPAKGLPVRVVARTAEHDFVMFTMNPVRDFGDPVTQSTAGSSASQFLGRHGGMQLIFCSSNASSADIIHEIGHAFGLFHEQKQGGSRRKCHY